jgi:hypothetical protein
VYRVAVAIVALAHIHTHMVGTGLRAGQVRIRSSILLQGQAVCLFSIKFKPAVGPTHYAVQRLPVVFFAGRQKAKL